MEGDKSWQQQNNINWISVYNFNEECFSTALILHGDMALSVWVF